MCFYARFESLDVVESRIAAENAQFSPSVSLLTASRRLTAMPHAANNTEMNAANAQRMCKSLDLNDPRKCWFLRELIWEWVDKAPTLLGKDLAGNTNIPNLMSLIKKSILPTFYEVSEDRAYAFCDDIRTLSDEIDAKIKISTQAKSDGQSFLKIYGASCTTLSQILVSMLQYSILDASESKRGMIEELLHKFQSLSPIEILLHLYNELPPTELWIGAGITAYESSPGDHWPYPWIILRQSMTDTVRRWYTIIPKLHLSVGDFHQRKVAFTAYYGVFDTINGENSKERSSIDARDVFNKLKEFARERRKESGNGNRVQLEKHSTVEEIQSAFDRFVRDRQLRFSLSDNRIYEGKSRNPRGYAAEATTQDTNRSEQTTNRVGRPKPTKTGGRNDKKGTKKPTDFLKVKKTIDKSNLSCHKCGEKGHFQAQCPKNVKSKDTTDMDA